ncbi:MAG TPA: hypothetical protein VKF36_05140 [Syntrophorhabdales bacterium]|nr:hypothetical protein [Syntrophorhabdales bacterium]
MRRFCLPGLVATVVALVIALASPIFCQESVYKVLNPRGIVKEVKITPLAPRVADLNDKVIYLVTPKQEGSHIEVALEKIGEALKKRFPNVKVIFKHKPSPYMTDDPDLWNEMVKNGNAFVYGAAPSNTSTYWGFTWACELEKKGLPGTVVMYEKLVDTAKNTTLMKGVPVRWATVTYPPQSMTEQQMGVMTDNIIKALTEPLNDNEKKTGVYVPPTPPRIAMEGIYSQVQDAFYKQGWTDGLPIVPPTEEKVREMLKGTKHAPGEVAGNRVWPEQWIATVEKVAINGVMAGCKPEYMPVLLATIEAWSKGVFTNVLSTNSFSYMLVVNGPIRKEINMNAGTYALGPGNHANATIGRALRLFIINLGGGQAGFNLMGTFGSPLGYTFCFPENEEASPWQPLSVDLGYKPGESVVTIFSDGRSLAGNYLDANVDRLIKAVRYFEWTRGLVVLFAPPAAKLQAEKGHTKKDVEEYIWKNATLTKKEFTSDFHYTWFIEPILKGKEMYGEKGTWPAEYLNLPDDAIVQAYPRKDVHVIVVGGEANPQMDALKFYIPETASVDKWR